MRKIIKDLKTEFNKDRNNEGNTSWNEDWIRNSISQTTQEESLRHRMNQAEDRIITGLEDKVENLDEITKNRKI